MDDGVPMKNFLDNQTQKGLGVRQAPTSRNASFRIPKQQATPGLGNTAASTTTWLPYKTVKQAWPNGSPGHL